MKKFFVIFSACLLLLIGIVAIQYQKFHDGKLHVVFCNVGQGDGIFIRTPNRKNIVIDGGPSNSILSCISSHTPFWERRIDLMFLTHPHEDHFIGLVDILSQYKVGAFATEDIANPTQNFIYLKDQIQKQDISYKNLWKGDVFRFADQVLIRVISPTKELVARTSPQGNIGERSEFASLVLLLAYGESTFLFTGDSQTKAMKEAAQIVGTVDVFQSPHHGSRTGLSREIIDILRPSIGVISVGKNSYGHPSNEVIKILKEKGVKTLRTDKDGDVHIVSDGSKVTVVQ